MIGPTYRDRGEISMRKALLGAVGLFALVVVAVAAAAPPVNVSSAGTPFSGCTADQAALQTSTLGSVNYPASEIEPRSARFGSHIVGAYQQDRWSDGGARGLATSISSDGGTTWSRVVIPKVSRCSGGDLDRATDPWVSFAPNGDLYAISFSFNAFDNRNAMLVSKSTNFGASWGDPITIIDDNPQGKKTIGGFNDKQAITADPVDSNYVYATWDRFISPPGEHAADPGRIKAHSYKQETWFARTTDGGRSWEPARKIYDPGTGAWVIGDEIVVTSEGDLLNATAAFIDNPRPAFGFKLVLVRSTDKGATWSKKATTIATLDLNDPGTTNPDNGEPVRSGGLPDFATGPNNTVYAVWQDDTLTPGIDSIMFSQSTDGGESWSTPIAINKTPTNLLAANRQAFTPTIAVTANGTVGVTYYDFRSNTNAAGALTNYWLVRCSSACTNFGNWSETGVAGPFDIGAAPVAGGYFLGDYMGLTTNGSTFQPFFIQSGAPTVPAPDGPTDAFFATVP